MANQSLTQHCLECPIYKNLGCSPVCPKYAVKESRYMIVGEAPGQTEVQEGVPFIGDAGQVLRYLIAKAGIDLDDVVLTNSCWCPPYREDGKIGTPEEEESRHCVRHVYLLMREVKPDVVIAVGAVAYKAMSGEDDYKVARHGSEFFPQVPFDLEYEEFQEWLKAKDISQLPYSELWEVQFNLDTDIEAAEWQVTVAKEKLGYSSFYEVPHIMSIHPSFIMRNEGPEPIGPHSQSAIRDLKDAKDIVEGYIPTPVNYRWIMELADWEAYVNETLSMYNSGKIEMIALDLETSEIDQIWAIPFNLGTRILTIQFSREDHEAVSVMVNHRASKFNDPATFRIFRHHLKRLLDVVPVVGQNVNFDYNTLRCKLGLRFKVIGDTMLEDHWLNMGRGLASNLDEMGARYLHTRHHKGSAKKWRVDHPNGTFEDFPLDLALEYSCGDADVTRRVHYHLKGLLEKEGRWKDYYDMHHGVHDVWQVITDTIHSGMPVDSTELSRLTTEYPARISQCLEEIHNTPFVSSMAKMDLESWNSEVEIYNKSIIGTKRRKKKTYTFDEWVADKDNRFNPSSWKQVLRLWKDIMKIPFSKMEESIEFSDVCQKCGGGGTGRTFKAACRCKTNRYIPQNPTTTQHNRNIMVVYLDKWQKMCESSMEEMYSNASPDMTIIKRTEDEMFTWFEMSRLIKLQSAHKDMEKLYTTYVENLPGLMPDKIPVEEVRPPSARTFDLYGPYCDYPPSNTIHPTYHLNGTETGRTCVAKGTLIEVLRDINVYPKGIPIEDVKVGDLVYCYDNSGNLSIKPVLWSGKTGLKNVVRVHWLGTGKRSRGYVDLTPDHLVRLTSGIYKEAGKLQCAGSRDFPKYRDNKGDTVLALSREIKSSGYAVLHITGAGCHREHNFVYDYFNEGHSFPMVHHIDTNPLNNRPDNLEGVDASGHRERHPMTDEAKRKLSETIKELYKNGSIPLHGLTGPDHPLWLGLEKDWIVEKLWYYQGRPAIMAHAEGIDFDTLKKYMEINGVDWKSIHSKFTKSGHLINRDFILEAREVFEKEGQLAAQKSVNMNFYKFKEIQEIMGFVPYNHIITGVEDLGAELDVYDLEVEDCNNFIAGGICVHNSSSNPNAQNFPKRKADRAADIKTVYSSRWKGKGGILVNPDLAQVEVRVMICECEDYELAKAVEDGLDFHSFVASKVYGIRMDQVTKEIRNPIKQTTFGLLYGQGVSTMASDLHLPLDKAEEIVDSYWKAMPKVHGWMKRQHEESKEFGYCTTKFGRKRWLTGIHSEDRGELARSLRECVNTPIQSAASDLCLTAMGRSWKKVKEIGIEAYPYAFVHDAITYDVCPGRFFDIMELSYYEMAIVPKKIYPWVICKTEASFDLGASWGLMCEANLKFSEDGKNFEHDWLDLRGKEKNIDALLKEIEKGGQKITILQSNQHPNEQEAAKGYWQKIVKIDRLDPKVLLINEELFILP